MNKIGKCLLIFSLLFTFSVSFASTEAAGLDSVKYYAQKVWNTVKGSVVGGSAGLMAGSLLTTALCVKDVFGGVSSGYDTLMLGLGVAAGGVIGGAAVGYSN